MDTLYFFIYWSSLISLNSILQIVAYMSFTSLVKCIYKYFIFLYAIINKIAFLIFF